MSRPRIHSALPSVAVVTGAVALLASHPVFASMATYTTSLQSGNMCSKCGPFGTVTVSSVAGDPDELAVTLTLTSGEVFANTGAGAALLFDISGDPKLQVMSLLPSGYSFHDSSTHADGSGTWDSYISCDICGSGTSPPQSSGPISFLLEASVALTPSSFVTNGSNGSGYLFASDIGVPDGSKGYSTGDVVTSGPLMPTPVPVPGAAWLLISGCAGLALTLAALATSSLGAAGFAAGSRGTRGGTRAAAA